MHDAGKKRTGTNMTRRAGKRFVFLKRQSFARTAGALSKKDALWSRELLPQLRGRRWTERCRPCLTNTSAARRALTALQDSDLLTLRGRQLGAIGELPAADVAEVVWCRGCVAWKKKRWHCRQPERTPFVNDINTNGQGFFCSYGEYQTNTGGDQMICLWFAPRGSARKEGS